MRKGRSDRPFLFAFTRMSAHLWDKSNVVDDCGSTLAFLGLVFHPRNQPDQLRLCYGARRCWIYSFRPQKKGLPNLPWGMGGIRPAQVNLEDSIEPSLA